MRRQSDSFSGSAGEPSRNDLYYQQSGSKMKGSAPLDIVQRSGLHNMSVSLPRLTAQDVQDVQNESYKKFSLHCISKTKYVFNKKR
jgi:hypothetical protein